MSISPSYSDESPTARAVPAEGDSLRALQESNQALSEFAHTVSHDLKAPLRHIVTYSDMLREIYGDQLGEDGRKFTSRLVINARRATRLIEDLLAFAEANEAPEEKSPVDFNALFHGIVETLQDTIDEAKASVTAAQLPAITAYPLRARQMLENLVINALTYKGAERPVINISATELENEYIFSVQDNGIGIEPAYQAQIFEPFKRLHSRDQIEGSGLGLAICRRIVELHGGKLWVESDIGQGATFFFTLPKN